MSLRVDCATLEAEIAQLGGLPFPDLQQLYQKHYKLEPPKRIGRTLLTLAIAYEIQRKAYGIRVGRLRKRAIAINSVTKARKGASKAEISSKRRSMQPGGRLVREWRGRKYEVYVADDGCYLDGKRFGSLSAAAEAITGVKRNGPAFFGLRSARVGSR